MWLREEHRTIHTLQMPTRRAIWNSLAYPVLKARLENGASILKIILRGQKCMPCSRNTVRVCGSISASSGAPRPWEGGAAPRDREPGGGGCCQAPSGRRGSAERRAARIRSPPASSEHLSSFPLHEGASFPRLSLLSPRGAPCCFSHWQMPAAFLPAVGGAGGGEGLGKRILRPGRLLHPRNQSVAGALT